LGNGKLFCFLYEIAKSDFSVRHAGSAKRFAEGAVAPFIHGFCLALQVVAWFLLEGRWFGESKRQFM